MTGLDIDAAKAEKWARGREKYGPVFVGHPLEQLDDELIDAMNYCEEAERRGYPMEEISKALRRLCMLVRVLLDPSKPIGRR